MNQKVSLPVIKRLPRYYRYICTLKSNDVLTISSSELAAMMGTTASQVRQDFNCFGGFGQQGIGYTVDLLRQELEKLLLGGTELDIILIGTGRLGRTVSHFISTEITGYNLTAVFDKSPEQIGTQMEDLTVQDIATLPAYCKQHSPAIAVLCVPSEGASGVASELTSLGIKGFWNFSHYDLKATSADIVVENVHLGDSLMSLGYQVRHPAEDNV